MVAQLPGGTDFSFLYPPGRWSIWCSLRCLRQNPKNAVMHLGHNKAGVFFVESWVLGVDWLIGWYEGWLMNRAGDEDVFLLEAHWIRTSTTHKINHHIDLKPEIYIATVTSLGFKCQKESTQKITHLWRCSFPFLFPSFLGYVSSFPEGSFFLPPHLFVNVPQGQVTLWTPYGTPGEAHGVACEIGWVKWPQGGGCAFEKGWNCSKHDYILYIHIIYVSFRSRRSFSWHHPTRYALRSRNIPLKCPDTSTICVGECLLNSQYQYLLKRLNTMVPRHEYNPSSSNTWRIIPVSKCWDHPHL